jgi:hypothetical protein
MSQNSIGHVYGPYFGHFRLLIVPLLALFLIFFLLLLPSPNSSPLDDEWLHVFLIMLAAMAGLGAGGRKARRRVGL